MNRDQLLEVLVGRIPLVMEELEKESFRLLGIWLFEIE